MTFTLAIAGRPNVGKSTLFNRLARKKLAIVDDTPGVTRDWREADGFLFDLPLRLIDTAGLEEKFDDSIEGRMRRQTEAGLKQADAVLFMVDGRSGITPMDEHFAAWLRKQGKPVILAVNKCENEKAAAAAIAEAYGLGLGDPVILSSAHGVGLDDLYNALRNLQPESDSSKNSDDNDIIEPAADDLPALDDIEGREDFSFEDRDPDSEDKPIKIAIAGRPNSGKSTLLNALIGEERVMTGPEAGTTRDAIAVKWTHQGRTFRLVDTAGLRRKARITDKIEQMATEDTLRAIRLAQIVIIVIDATLGIEKQDLQIARHILEEGRALIIAVNKWDVVEDKKKTLQDISDRLQTSLAQVPDVPVVTLSALTGRHVEKLMVEALRLFRLWNARVGTSSMNRWLAMMESRHPAPAAHGRPNRLKYITQIKTRPPTFAMWVARPDDLPEEYKRYIINGLRENFDLSGVPVRLLIRASKNPYA